MKRREPVALSRGLFSEEPLVATQSVPCQALTQPLVFFRVPAKIYRELIFRSQVLLTTCDYINNIFIF